MISENEYLLIKHVLGGSKSPISVYPSLASRGYRMGSDSQTSERLPLPLRHPDATPQTLYTARNETSFPAEFIQTVAPEEFRDFGIMGNLASSDVIIDVSVHSCPESKDSRRTK